MAKTDKTYVCAAGMDHPKGRNETGDKFTGPAKSLPWLIEQGYVVEDGSDEHAALVAALEAPDEADAVAPDETVEG